MNARITSFGRGVGIALAVALVGTLAGWAAARAAAPVEPAFKWLCKPGLAGDPCVGQPGGLLTKRVLADGSGTTSKPKALPRLRSKVDCFYVYPTVSGQAATNADLSKDPELDGIARQQAARFAPGCRMFAPVYRQFTVAAILGGGVGDEATEIAYRSLRAAWRRYISRFNRGRGIVLIGHSQGTGHLKRLISETFDRRPNLRKRLVSAVLIGGNVIVPKGRRVGGNFRKVPACVKARETGCVIAFSSFLEDPPPSDALFGRLGGALVEPGFDPDRFEVLCVNPARLDGSRGALRPLYDTQPFPGIYGPLLPDLSGAGAPWASFPGLYSASCRKQESASWLRIHEAAGPTDPRPRVGEPLGRTWGTHLTEVNDALGNLVSVVKRQEAAYVKKANRAKLNEQVRRPRR